MLISFSVSNFLSFDKKVVFSLLPSQSQQHKDHIAPAEPYGILRAAVLYGANASGKTNFFDAIGYFVEMVRTGIIPDLLSQNQFMLHEHNHITSFETIFQFNKKIFKYSVDISPDEIKHEKLLRLYKTTNTEELLFDRQGLDISLGKNLQKSKSNSNWYTNRTFQKNMLYLTKLRSDGIFENKDLIGGSDLIIDVHNFFLKIELCKPESIMRPDVFSNLIKAQEYQDFLLNLLENSDTGITGLDWVELSEAEAMQQWRDAILANPMNIRYENLSENNALFGRRGPSFYKLYAKDGKQCAKTLKTFHGTNKPFSLESESAGTRRLIDLSLAFYKLLKDDYISFIDELDCSLHPMLAKFLIQEFFRMTSRSQLIISVHNTHLLDKEIWRPDEIWFVEKQPNGASDMYSSSQFRPRFDKNLANDYYRGKYGAIPFLGRLSV